MAEAKIQLRDGATVDVRGTPEEVARIVGILERPEGTGHPKSDTEANAGIESGPTKPGPRGYILELKAEGFFKGQRRSIRDIQEGLEARGHIYPVTTLSGALLHLVKKRQLGRVKQDGFWLYVQRA